MRVDVNTKHAALYRHWKPSLSRLKQQFGLTHRYTILQGTEKKIDRSSVDRHVSMLCFYENIRTGNFLWKQHFGRCVCNPKWESQFGEFFGLRQIAFRERYTKSDIRALGLYRSLCSHCPWYEVSKITYRFAAWKIKGLKQHRVT
jgi:hypothetical protein